MNKSIGGYFGMETGSGKDYHPKAIKLNTGRNCLTYIILSRGIKKIYLPYYCCDVLLEPLVKLRTEFAFYHINRLLDPVFNIAIKQNEAFLFINYFGLKQKKIPDLKNVFYNLIVDNAQSFFDKPYAGTDTFYSARKFFGVPDGAYLYCEKNLQKSLPIDDSIDRTRHLMLRETISAEAGFDGYLKNEEALSKVPLRQMSLLTKTMLNKTDYQKYKAIREKNFLIMHNAFASVNEMVIGQSINGPMFYPLLINKKGLREKLHANKIYVAKYWENVLKRTKKEDFEYYLADNLIPLPIDQRYSAKEMKEMIKFVKAIL